MKKLVFIFILVQSIAFASWDMAISNAMVALKSYYAYDVANYKKSLVEVVKQSEEAILDPKNGEFVVDLPKKSSQMLQGIDKSGKLNEQFGRILNLSFKQNVPFVSKTLQNAISNLSKDETMRIMNGELLSSYLKKNTYSKLSSSFKNIISDVAKRPEFKDAMQKANLSKDRFQNYLVDDFLDELFAFLQNNEKDFMADPFGFSVNKAANMKR